MGGALTPPTVPDRESETTMAETISGGATRDASGTWRNAEGQPLTKTQIAQAEALMAEREAERAVQHRAALAAEAQRDPTARALAAALAPRQADPADEAPAQDAPKPKK